MKKPKDKTSFLDAKRQASRTRIGQIVTLGVILLLATVVMVWRLGYLGGASTSSASVMTNSLIASSWSDFSIRDKTVPEQDTVAVAWSRCPLLWPEEEGRSPKTTRSVTPRKSSSAPRQLHLSGVIRGDDGSYAFINGKAISLGEMIDGYQLVGIEDDHVQVSSMESGKTYTIRKRDVDPILEETKESHEGGGR